MYYWLWGVLWLLVGSLFLGWGTSGWWPWKRPTEIAKRKTIVLAVAVIMGGLFTTLGWNQFSAQAQEQSDERFRQALSKTNQDFRASLEKTNLEFRRDLDQRDQKSKAAQEERDLQLRKAKKNATILAVAKEWKLNEMTRARQPFSDYDKGERDKLLAGFFFLPKFENVQSELACTSEVLDWTAHDDQALLSSMVGYARIIEVFNQTADLVNADRTALMQTKGHERELNEAVFGERGGYPMFLMHHNSFGELLRRDYKWVFDDVGAMSAPMQGPNRDGASQGHPYRVPVK